MFIDELARYCDRKAVSLNGTMISFTVEMKSNKDTRCKQTNCRPDYILDRRDIWCRFWKLCCSVIRTWSRCLRWRPEQEFFTADKMAWNFTSTLCMWRIYVSLWDLRLPKLNVFWLKHLLGGWFVLRRTSLLSSQKGQITLKCSLNFSFTKI